MRAIASAAEHTRGFLSTTPLPELLVLGLERKLSGSFSFETPDGAKSALVLEQGHVCKVRTARPSNPLGRLLIEAGMLDPTTLSRGLLIASEQGRHLGEELVRLRALAPGELEATLGEQLARRVSMLGQLPPASAFAFWANRDLLAERPGAHVEPLALIWRCVRDAENPYPRQDAVLSRLGSAPLRLHVASTPERFGLDADERSWLAGLAREPQPLEAVLARRGLEPRRARRLVYTLALTRHLDRGDESLPLESTPPPAAPVPPLAPPLSGSRSASAPPPSGARPPSTPPAAHIERALEKTRVPSGGGSILATEAALAFEAAQRWLALERFERAEPLARLASETEPGNAEYLALHAWLRALRGELSSPQKANQIVAALDRAVMKQRSSTSIRFYRARVLQRMGRDVDALKDFRFVVRREPAHVDAMREVRLYEMRARNRAKKAGLLARLFQR
jgi:hypothetical protein